MVMSGNKATKSSVAASLSAWQEQYSYLQRVWGTVTVTEYYDAGFVAAKNTEKLLAAKYRVELESFNTGV